MQYHDNVCLICGASVYCPAMMIKRYTTFTGELRRLFGCRVQRISLDAGFSCPNRDGTVGTGGCNFCNERGAAAAGIPVELPVAEQLQRSKEYLRHKFRAERYLAYFQAYSNTYASADRLRNLYEAALQDKDVVGIVIGTRPDCLPEDVLDLLAELACKTYLWLELGMQTMHNSTLASINRGHDHACFVRAVNSCRERGIRICAHLILGLPGETGSMMLESVSEINRLGLDGVKLHHLHVLRGSQFESVYRAGQLRLMERDEYVELVCDVIEHLDPDILIHRLMGDGRSELVAPDWSRRKLELLNLIDATLEKRGSRQGSRMPLCQVF